VYLPPSFTIRTRAQVKRPEHKNHLTTYFHIPHPALPHNSTAFIEFYLQLVCIAGDILCTIYAMLMLGILSLLCYTWGYTNCPSRTIYPLHYAFLQERILYKLPTFFKDEKSYSYLKSARKYGTSRVKIKLIGGPTCLIKRNLLLSLLLLLSL
jgi:hypothetical protein